jgi:hypothetical protein
VQFPPKRPVVLLAARHQKSVPGRLISRARVSAQRNREGPASVPTEAGRGSSLRRLIPTAEGCSRRRELRSSASARLGLGGQVGEVGAELFDRLLADACAPRGVPRLALATINNGLMATNNRDAMAWVAR